MVVALAEYLAQWHVPQCLSTFTALLANEQHVLPPADPQQLPRTHLSKDFPPEVAGSYHDISVTTTATPCLQRRHVLVSVPAGPPSALVTRSPSLRRCPLCAISVAVPSGPFLWATVCLNTHRDYSRDPAVTHQGAVVPGSDAETSTITATIASSLVATTPVSTTGCEGTVGLGIPPASCTKEQCAQERQATPNQSSCSDDSRLEIPRYPRVLSAISKSMIIQESPCHLIVVDLEDGMALASVTGEARASLEGLPSARDGLIIDGMGPRTTGPVHTNRAGHVAGQSWLPVLPCVSLLESEVIDDADFIHPFDLNSEDSRSIVVGYHSGRCAIVAVPLQGGKTASSTTATLAGANSAGKKVDRVLVSNETGPVNLVHTHGQWLMWACPEGLKLFDLKAREKIALVKLPSQSESLWVRPVVAMPTPALSYSPALSVGGISRRGGSAGITSSISTGPSINASTSNTENDTFVLWNEKLEFKVFRIHKVATASGFKQVSTVLHHVKPKLAHYLSGNTALPSHWRLRAVSAVGVEANGGLKELHEKLDNESELDWHVYFHLWMTDDATALISLDGLVVAVNDPPIRPSFSASRPSSIDGIGRTVDVAKAGVASEADAAAISPSRAATATGYGNVSPMKDGWSNTADNSYGSGGPSVSTITGCLSVGAEGPTEVGATILDSGFGTILWTHAAPQNFSPEVLAEEGFVSEKILYWEPYLKALRRGSRMALIQLPVAIGRGVPPHRCLESLWVTQHLDADLVEGICRQLRPLLSRLAEDSAPLIATVLLILAPQGTSHPVIAESLFMTAWEMTSGSEGLVAYTKTLELPAALIGSLLKLPADSERTPWVLALTLEHLYRHATDAPALSASWAAALDAFSVLPASETARGIVLEALLHEQLVANWASSVKSLLVALGRPRGVGEPGAAATTGSVREGPLITNLADGLSKFEATLATVCGLLLRPLPPINGPHMSNALPHSDYTELIRVAAAPPIDVCTMLRIDLLDSEGANSRMASQMFKRQSSSRSAGSSSESLANQYCRGRGRRNGDHKVGDEQKKNAETAVTLNEREAFIVLRQAMYIQDDLTEAGNESWLGAALLEGLRLNPSWILHETTTRGRLRALLEHLGPVNLQQLWQFPSESLSDAGQVARLAILLLTDNARTVEIELENKKLFDSWFIWVAVTNNVAGFRRLLIALNKNEADRQRFCGENSVARFVMTAQGLEPREHRWLCVVLSIMGHQTDHPLQELRHSVNRLFEAFVLTSSPNAIGAEKGLGTNHVETSVTVGDREGRGAPFKNQSNDKLGGCANMSAAEPLAVKVLRVLDENLIGVELPYGLVAAELRVLETFRRLAGVTRLRCLAEEGYASAILGESCRRDCRSSLGGSTRSRSLCAGRATASLTDIPL